MVYQPFWIILWQEFKEKKLMHFHIFNRCFFFFLFARFLIEYETFFLMQIFQLPYKWDPKLYYNAGSKI